MEAFELKDITNLFVKKNYFSLKIKILFISSFTPQTFFVHGLPLQATLLPNHPF